MKKTKFKNRRAFLKGIVRLGILTGFISMGIALGLRKNEETDVSDTCPVTGPCETCGQRMDCRKYNK
jgi:hypothetical protein